MQDMPVCFNCGERVGAIDAVFEPPCGHDEHASAVWHGLCLMGWRENCEQRTKRLHQFIGEVERIYAELEDES